MKKFILSKELLIKDITYDDFVSKLTGDYNIVQDEKELKFKWGNIETKEVSHFLYNETLGKYDTTNLNFNLVKAKISSINHDEIIEKDIPILVLEDSVNNNIQLMIKGDNNTQKKIRSKLLGKYTSNIRVKNLWREHEVKIVEKTFDLKFLLWIIKMYKDNTELSFDNFKFKIVDIFYISDNGVYMGKIKRTGHGKTIIEDPIIKAIISSIETIDSIGIKIIFEGGEIEFILHDTGEIDLSPETEIRSPVTMKMDVEDNPEKILFFIKKRVLGNLFELFQLERNLDEDIKLMKLDYLIEMIKQLEELSGEGVVDELLKGLNSKITE